MTDISSPLSIQDIRKSYASNLVLDGISFDLIRGFQVEFLKIDGSVILDMLRDPVDLAKVVSINRVAKMIGVKTVAELVESEELIAKLKEVGIDFAQGFGISRPRSLEE